MAGHANHKLRDLPTNTACASVIIMKVCARFLTEIRNSEAKVEFQRGFDAAVLSSPGINL
jgi:hypothetical protein